LYVDLQQALNIHSIVVLNSIGQVIDLPVVNIEESRWVFNVEELNSGIYFLSIETDQAYIQKKFVVMK